MGKRLTRVMLKAYTHFLSRKHLSMPLDLQNVQHRGDMKLAVLGPLGTYTHQVDIEHCLWSAALTIFPQQAAYKRFGTGATYIAKGSIRGISQTAVVPSQYRNLCRCFQCVGEWSRTISHSVWKLNTWSCGRDIGITSVEIVCRWAICFWNDRVRSESLPCFATRHSGRQRPGHLQPWAGV